MPSKRVFLIVAAVSVVLLGLSVVFLKGRQGREIAPLPESAVDLTVTDDGTTYKLSHGDLYRVNSGSGKWEFAKRIYEPDYRTQNYIERDGAVFRKAGDGDPIPVKRSFADDFEGTKSLADLIGIKRGWTSCELQSPQTPTVKDYVKLRNGILKGESDFLDNRIEPSGEVVHGGMTALKCVAVPASREMVTSKSSLSTELVHFVKGDDVWMSMWCHVPAGSGVPFTVFDLETTWLSEQPGIRIVISDGKYACFQLKWFGRPYYRQPKGKEAAFPTGRWVHLKAHLKLTEKDDGVIELWQDGQKIIDARGQTLVLADAIYNSFEIGTSAYDEKDKPSTFYVDDVSISDRPMPN